MLALRFPSPLQPLQPLCSLSRRISLPSDEAPGTDGLLGQVGTPIYAVVAHRNNAPQLLPQTLVIGLGESLETAFEMATSEQIPHNESPFAAQIVATKVSLGKLNASTVMVSPTQDSTATVQFASKLSPDLLWDGTYGRLLQTVMTMYGLGPLCHERSLLSLGEQTL